MRDLTNKESCTISILATIIGLGVATMIDKIIGTICLAIGTVGFAYTFYKMYKDRKGITKTETEIQVTADDTIAFKIILLGLLFTAFTRKFIVKNEQGKNLLLQVTETEQTFFNPVF